MGLTAGCHNSKHRKMKLHFLTSLLSKSWKTDVRYTFGTESDPNDPRNQSEDLGNDSMLAKYMESKISANRTSNSNMVVRT